MSALAVARRELLSLFLSPLAWAILAIVQLIGAWVFLNQLQQFLAVQAQLAQLPGAPGATAAVVVPLYATTAIVLMLVVPLLTMRLISEERRTGTLPLLMSAPLSMTEIVLGKYLGVLGFLLLTVALISLMPAALWWVGDLDTGLWAATLLGLVLLSAAFATLGLFLSSLTAQPAVAAVSTFGALLLLWLLDWANGPGSESGLLGQLSALAHFEPFSRGLVRATDLAYFTLFVFTFMALSVQRLDAQRLRG